MLYAALHLKRMHHTLWLEHTGAQAHSNAQCLALWVMISFVMPPARCWSVVTWKRWNDSVIATCRPMPEALKQLSLAGDRQVVATKCIISLARHWQHSLQAYVADFLQVATRHAWPGPSMVRALKMCSRRQLCSIPPAACMTHHWSSTKWKPVFTRSLKKFIRQLLNSRWSKKNHALFCFHSIGHNVLSHRLCALFCQHF